MWRSCAGVLLMMITGCISSMPNRVPRPEIVEEFTVPPDDSRYNLPPEFPKDQTQMARGKRKSTTPPPYDTSPTSRPTRSISGSTARPY